MAMRDSSKRWLDRRNRDLFVRRARAEQYRSRAAYKLIQIDQRAALFKRGQAVVDLGAAPGSWSQFVARKIGEQSTIIAIDLADMEPISGVRIINADIQDPALPAKIRNILPKSADIVLSDLAPATTGHRSTDQARSEKLACAAFSLAGQILAPQGDFLVKTRHGGWDELIIRLKARFAKVKLIKPAASRGQSPEIYLLARGYQPL